MKTSEGYFVNSRSQKLYFRVWEPETYKSTLVITHGQGEHCLAYERLVHGLAGLPMRIIAWDLVGNGRSEGQRGYAEKFDDYVTDFIGFFSRLIAESPKDHKFVALAHSMGGLVQTLGLTDNPNWMETSVVAQVLSAPLFGLALDVPWIKDAGARVLNKLVPMVTLYDEIRNETLTRDAEIIKEYERDPFRHHKISAGVYLGFLEKFPLVPEKASRIKVPTLLQISSADPIVSTPAAEAYFKSLKGQGHQWITYENACHEIYNDIIRDQAFADLKKFLESVLLRNEK